jgi:L-ribulose-5-phosphate 4-epimerase
LVVIKASGIRYKKMCPEHMVVMDISGKAVVESIGKSPAVLLKNHGVFTIGKNATAAVKAAVMTGGVAATVWMALEICTPDVIPQEDVEKLHYRYTNVYGQQTVDRG